MSPKCIQVADTSKSSIQQKLDVLLKELKFLESGGYHPAIGWRLRLVFEDSPVCSKPPVPGCHHCLLLEFVPVESRDEAIPCRHIPLNQAGETIQSLYNTASAEEIEKTLWEWLKTKIAELQQSASDGGDAYLGISRIPSPA